MLPALSSFLSPSRTCLMNSTTRTNKTRKTRMRLKKTTSILRIRIKTRTLISSEGRAMFIWRTERGCSRGTVPGVQEHKSRKGEQARKQEEDLILRSCCIILSSSDHVRKEEKEDSLYHSQSIIQSNSSPSLRSRRRRVQLRTDLVKRTLSLSAATRLRSNWCIPVKLYPSCRSSFGTPNIAGLDRPFAIYLSCVAIRVNLGCKF